MAEGFEGKDRRGWHLKKEISLGDAVAIVSAAAAILYAYSTLDKRVTVLEVSATTQKVIDVKQDEEAVRYQARIDEALRTINGKLDRLIERGGRNL